MNCPRHPEKRTVTACKDCGAEFCIDCVRETDQTNFCPDCYRRKLGAMAGEHGLPEEERRRESAIPIEPERPERLPKPEIAKPGAEPEVGASKAEKQRRTRAERKQELALRRQRLAGIQPRAVPEPFEERPVAKPPEEKALLEPARDKAVTEPPRVKPVAKPPEEKALLEPARDKAVTEPPRVKPVAKPPEEKALLEPAKDKAVTEPPRAKPVAKPPEDKALLEPAKDEAIQEPTGDEFLTRGPDEDFSFLEPEKKGRKKRSRPWAEAARGRKPAATPMGKEPSKVAEAVSSDDLLADVVSTLMMPEIEEDLIEEVEEPGKKPEEKVGEKPRRRVRVPKHTPDEIKAARAERLERWAFLAQPRASSETVIAPNWWRATIFIGLMLMIGAVLWAVPNAYFIPKDSEYGLHALLIGIIMGLIFWRKAGKKHSNRLAIQAALVTFFSIFIGEFLHWFLIVMKNQAFRTIFFDLISFKFLWQNGAEIMKNMIEAMFPMAFLWILLLPTAAAFMIGFGMPPIPEIFFQIGRALKGQSPEEGEAGHGLES